MPVLVIDDLAHAAPLARALVAGGLPALEVTLRTPCALDAIRAMAQVPGGVVGAGTLLTPADVKAAKAAGASFGVSPGATARLIAACEDEGLPLLPGAVTASEVMALLERGYTVQKFFPAEQSGGAAFLKSLGSPIPQVSFCPTGGISLKNAADYLSLKTVLCVGGRLGCAKRGHGQGRLGRDHRACRRGACASALTEALASCRLGNIARAAKGSRMSAASVQTCLWFSDHAEEAARTYAALIPGSEILQVFPNRADPSQAFLVHLSLAGQRYTPSSTVVRITP